MTRKDFELIASTLAEYRGAVEDSALDAMAETFARKLANTNVNFNYARFIAATRTTMTTTPSGAVASSRGGR